MRIPRRICAFIYTLTFSVAAVCCSTGAYAQYATADTIPAGDTTETPKVKKKDFAGHQLCIGADYFRPIINSFIGNQYSYEAQASYYLHNEYYITAEGGWGGVTVDYPDLKYSSTNNFLRFGFDRCVLGRDSPRDWDGMLIGLRLCGAQINRASAAYSVVDSFWGNAPGNSIPQTFYAYWMELTGGVRVEIVKGLMLGWNMRGKFLLNGHSIKKYEPDPLYVAGYGRGDKTAVFDFNMYVSYAIRWRRKSLGPIDPKTGLPPIAKPMLAPDKTKEPPQSEE